MQTLQSLSCPWPAHSVHVLCISMCSAAAARTYCDTCSRTYKVFAAQRCMVIQYMACRCSAAWKSCMSSTSWGCAALLCPAAAVLLLGPGMVMDQCCVGPPPYLLHPNAAACLRPPGAPSLSLTPASGISTWQYCSSLCKHARWHQHCWPVIGNPPQHAPTGCTERLAPGSHGPAVRCTLVLLVAFPIMHSIPDHAQHMQPATHCLAVASAAALPLQLQTEVIHCQLLVALPEADERLHTTAPQCTQPACSALSQLAAHSASLQCTQPAYSVVMMTQMSAMVKS